MICFLVNLIVNSLEADPTWYHREVRMASDSADASCNFDEVFRVATCLQRSYYLPQGPFWFSSRSWSSVNWQCARKSWGVIFFIVFLTKKLTEAFSYREEVLRGCFWLLSWRKNLVVLFHSLTESWGAIIEFLEKEVRGAFCFSVWGSLEGAKVLHRRLFNDGFSLNTDKIGWEGGMKEFLEVRGLK